MDRQLRDCARDWEYRASMAAYEMWRAGDLVASMDAPTEREELQQMDVLNRIARARQHLGEITYPASERGYGRQARLELDRVEQLRLLSA
jgi:hypothetical protein